MDFKTPIEQLFYTTVRIETSSPNGPGTGTGFGFHYQHQSDHQFPFIVTNKHVIKDAISGRFFFTLEKDNAPLVGKRIDINFDNFEALWHGHPDPNIDVTVMPYMPVLTLLQSAGHSVFFKSFPNSMVPTLEQVNELNALEEITFVGYPNGIYDSLNLLPILRKGTTATPVQIDYEGKPIFLVDASVFPGSSGSPVLICNTGGFATKNGFAVGNRVMLLGLIASVLVQKENNALRFVSIPTTTTIPFVRTTQMIDLGVVFKASTILETIHSFLQKHGVA